MPKKAVEEGKSSRPTEKDQARSFLKEIIKKSDEPNLVIRNPLPNKPEDLLLITLASMRRKTPEEYESVVEGLHQLVATPGTKASERATIEKLSGHLEDIAEILFPGQVNFH